MICEICKKEYAHLGLHIKYAHKDYDAKRYYDEFLKKEDEGICLHPDCLNKTEFMDLSHGYKKHCCKRCADTDPKTLEKYRSTCNEKYGTDSNMRSEIGKAEYKKSIELKYGVDHIWKVKDIHEKCIETAHVKNPLDPFNSKKRLLNTDMNLRNEKISKSLREMDSEKKQKIYENVKNSRIRNNGAYWTDVMKNKSENTCIEKYGYRNWICNPDNYRKTLKNRLDKNGGYLSKSEKMFSEMLNNRGIEFKYNYYYNGKHWDFVIFKDNKIELVIEIDGEYNHGLLNDPDGKHVKGDNDHERFLKLDNVKFLVIDSKNIKNGIKETINMLDMNYDEFIDNIVEQCNIDFPYPEYSMKRMNDDYNRLCKYDNLKGKQTYSIITNYHRSIWKCNLKNKKSPYDAWYDKSLLRKCIENRFIYKSVLSTQNILNGFNICKLAPRISLFNPNVSKYIVKKYLNEFNEVFDPFSGYSGRMLGVCASGKQYIGQDINEKTVNESNKIINDFKLNAKVYVKDIFKSNGVYECLFTCSPYNDKENWGQDIKNLSCDEWIDICLKNFKCKKYIFIVDHTNKYKDNIVETINNKSHFNENNEKVILIENNV